MWVLRIQHGSSGIKENTISEPSFLHPLLRFIFIVLRAMIQWGGCSQKPKEDVGALRAGVRDGCEMWVLETEQESTGRAASTLNC